MCYSCLARSFIQLIVITNSNSIINTGIFFHLPSSGIASCVQTMLVVTCSTLFGATLLCSSRVDSLVYIPRYVHLAVAIEVRARTIELYIYEHTNVPRSSERTWTLFHHPLQMQLKVQMHVQIGAGLVQFWAEVFLSCSTNICIPSFYHLLYTHK